MKDVKVIINFIEGTKEIIFLFIKKIVSVTEGKKHNNLLLLKP